MGHGNMIESSNKVCNALKGYADTNEVLGAYTEAETARKAIDEIEFLNRYIINLKTAFRTNLLFHVSNADHKQIDTLLAEIEKKSMEGFM